MSSATYFVRWGWKGQKKRENPVQDRAPGPVVRECRAAGDFPDLGLSDYANGRDELICRREDDGGRQDWMSGS